MKKERERRKVKERREEGLDPRWLEQYGLERGRRLNGMRLLRYGGIGEKKGEKETGRISRSQTMNGRRRRSTRRGRRGGLA